METQIAAVNVKANHDSEIYSIVVTFLLLAVVAVVLRFFTVITLRHQRPAVDDYMIGVSLVSREALANSLSRISGSHGFR